MTRLYSEALGNHDRNRVRERKRQDRRDNYVRPSPWLRHLNAQALEQRLG